MLYPRADKTATTINRKQNQPRYWSYVDIKLEPMEKTTFKKNCNNTNKAYKVILYYKMTIIKQKREEIKFSWQRIPIFLI